MTLKSNPFPVRLGLLMAALLMFGCADESSGPDPAEAVESPAPVTAAPAEPAAAPAQAPTIERPPAPLQLPEKDTVEAVEIGAEPVRTVQDAFNTANRAMDVYAQRHGLDRSRFYVKETVAEGDGWKVLFFGDQDGQGAYVTIRIHPDGRYEFTH